MMLYLIALGVIGRKKGLKILTIGEGAFLKESSNVDIYGSMFSLKTNQEC
tara:strand:+ start:634 stop:783 length:150 start_codon:yes stop_codon:yes gene_type:complete